MITVKATREGLTGAVTASGYHIDNFTPFVALPSEKALGKFVVVTNPLTGQFTPAVVLDVGPWNAHDDAYVFGGGTVRPQAESGVSVSGKGTNGAGIDLGEKVWHVLGMTDNTDVEWEWLEVPGR